MVADDHALEAQLGHGPLNLGDGARRVLHRQCHQPGESGRVHIHHLPDLVVARAGDPLGHLQIVAALVEPDRGGDELEVDPELVHVGQMLGEGLVEPPEPELTGDRVQAMPLAAVPDPLLVALRRDVGVHVDHRHRV